MMFVRTGRDGELDHLSRPRLSLDGPVSSKRGISEQFQHISFRRQLDAPRGGKTTHGLRRLHQARLAAVEHHRVIRLLHSIFAGTIFDLQEKLTTQRGRPAR